MIPIILLALILNTAESAVGSQTKIQLSFEVQGGAGIPAEESLNTHVVSGFGVTIPMEKRLSLSLDLGYWRSNVEEAPDKFHDGHLKAFPLLASLQFFLSRQNRVNPYVFLGGGYIFCSFEMEDIITIPEITIDQSVKSGSCLQAGFGIGVPISRSFGLFTEAIFFYRKTKGITTIADLNFGISTKEFPVNLSAWIFQIGIKYFIK
jgi:outer membrane protein W